MSSQDRPSPPKPWFQAGLRFECQRCGACCTNHGDHAYVYVRVSEARAIAANLGIGWPEFRRDHLSEHDGYLHFKNTAGACPYLGPKKECSIYPLRPMQCRSWPFWRENLKQAVWQGEVQRTCPGVGQGRTYERAEIEAIARENERWYEQDEPEELDG